MENKQLWAPWRMEFLKSPRDKTTGCVFCLAVQHTRDNDKEKLILFRDKTSFVILNKYPYSNGHLMVIPNRHTADFLSLNEEENHEMAMLTQHCVRTLGEVYRAAGFNLGMNLGQAGGAGIKEHLHQHIVPRWPGDTNFMPVIAEIKTMPQHLASTYDQLLPHFERLDTI